MAAYKQEPGDKGVESLATLPPWSIPFHPLVDLVASVRASVHAKLLFGFLIGALLLLGMAILSLLVIERMTQRVANIAGLQEDVDRARRMEYLITAQSHFRAMALLTQRDFYNEDIALAKKEFSEHLDAAEQGSPAAKQGFFQNVRESDERFAVSSAQVLDLYQSGNIEEALTVHISQEHVLSHVIEDSMRTLQVDAVSQMDSSRENFASDARLIKTIVLIFSGVSLVTALSMGFVTSWAFLRPVRAIDNALAHIALGDFDQRVNVPNRDEFGSLSTNLNIMSQQLASLYEELSTVNETLSLRLEDLQEAHYQLSAYASQAELYAAAQERGRLARELHDSVTQTMFSMTLISEAARIQLHRDPAEAVPLLDNLQELAKSALSAMRSLIQQSRASSVDEEGLAAAIRRHLDALEASGRLKVDFQVEGEGHLSKEQEEELFGVVQEALNNVSKHSRSDRALVKLSIEDEEALLLIQDHGVGFDLAEVEKNSEGFGLTSIRERVDMVGGVLEIESAQGSGTQVRVRLFRPLESANIGKD